MSLSLPACVAAIVLAAPAFGDTSQSPAQAADPPPGTVFADRLASGEVGPDMVVLPAGAFLMGSPADEPRRLAHEGPQRRVDIAQPFAVGRTEVTVGQWNACVAAGACRSIPLEPLPDPNAPPMVVADRDRREDPARPMVEVTWEDAQAYVGWLSEETGASYRLLTEAEWEYAARAATEPGEHAPYSWGEEPPICDRHAAAAATFYDCGQRLPARVAGSPPNAFGLHDMHGNAWEWAADCWNHDHHGAPSDASARLDGACHLRVMRGGGFASYGHQLRAAFRSWTHAGSGFSELGFRVARDPPFLRDGG